MAEARQPGRRTAKRGLQIRPGPIRLIRTVEEEVEHLAQTVEGEVQHLAQVAEAGESEETPAIVIGVVAVFVAGVVAIVLAIAFAAYYLG